MTKVLRGVVHGKIIEITEDLGMLDGQAVDLIVMPSDPINGPTMGAGAQTSPKTLPGPPPGWRPGASPTSAGLLAQEWTVEDDSVLDDIHAERKASKWRELPE
jgi:hypothetical protein